MRYKQYGLVTGAVSFVGEVWNVGSLVPQGGSFSLTMLATGSLTTANLQLEASNDGTNFTILTTGAVSGGSYKTSTTEKFNFYRPSFSTTAGSSALLISMIC